MSTRPLSNPHGYNGLKMARNAHQGRQEGESLEAFKARRARGVCVNIAAEIAELRETFGLCIRGGIVRDAVRSDFQNARSRYQLVLARARPLP